MIAASSASLFRTDDCCHGNVSIYSQRLMRSDEEQVAGEVRETEGRRDRSAADSELKHAKAHLPHWRCARSSGR